MATIKILGDAFVVTSSVTLDTLVKLAKFKPKALSLVDPESKDLYYKANAGTDACFTKYGITFTGKDDNGNATATFAIPTGLSNEAKKEFIKTNFGYSLLNLNKVEEQITLVSDQTDAEFEAMESSIEIL